MIIGLSGYARSGKDTVAELLCLNYGYSRHAFADQIKKVLYRLNPIIGATMKGDVCHLNEEMLYNDWDYLKDNTDVRRLMQVLGTEIGREMFGDNVWVDLAFKHIKAEDVVFTDVRFPNEADAIRNAGGQVWRINRLNHEPINDHSSETAMDEYAFDHTIKNNGTLDDLSDEVFMLSHSLGLNKIKA
jgi:hypothetical protein